MSDPNRHRYGTATSGRRSPPLYNPARASMPIPPSAGYTSLYSGDVVLPPPHHEHHDHHDALVSRPPPDYRREPAPVTTTYAVRKDSIPRTSSVKDDTSRTHRPAAADTATAPKRPIIVTTKHTSGNHAAGGARTGSPTREPYRASDEGQYYSQPASSINRSRSTTRAAPYSAAMDNDEYLRLKERTEHDRLLNPRPTDPYRSSRPTVLYANTPHRTTTMEFDDEGYEYTKPSDLARYDLDHDKPRRSRRESLDRYYRPTVSVTTDLASRPYEQNERRQRGPPPTTWGLDKIPRAPYDAAPRVPAGGIYDGAGTRMPIIPPTAPLVPDVSRRTGVPEAPRSPERPERRAASRTRPISLIQDSSGRPTHHDDYYRSREDELIQRELRERDLFQDDRVTSRGFGIRTDEPEEHHEHQRPLESSYRDDRRERQGLRHETRGEINDREPRKSSYDDLDIVRRRDYEDLDRRSHRDRDYDRDPRGDRESRTDDDVVRDRRDGKGKETALPEDDRDTRKDKLRDKVAAGIGLAAASVGLVPPPKDRDDRDDRDDGDDASSSSRRRKDGSADRRRPDDEPRSRATRKEPLLGDEDFEIIDHPQERDHSRREDSAETGSSHQDRNDLNGEAVAISRDHSSSTDEGKPTRSRRRRRASSAFNPNDTDSLAILKAQIAEQNREKAQTTEKQTPAVREPSPERKSSTAPELPADTDSTPGSPGEEESRGRELAPASREEKQVRVVSPPRDKDEKKPIKGILKQPKPQFPEEPNPIREGVAPHKDDKTKVNVPTGARWTKISRKMVNPEALTIGKERFEVRDEFVIVLRVLSKEEIQEYAAATAQLRGGLRIFPASGWFVFFFHPLPVPASAAPFDL
ncbi:hypothetical protein B0H67DRAFT_15793 [Lasiosphaeris hirsuta]|uniref:DUF8035 domain-containing protein n=1 Tax=Lasiosphaeris hirsuta TaxID=260670 RepID=A0AA40B948_9PEZI|nr:hypothetical protein B0H67DRAFT_15793 [Lasiosphaeris hirsuta]